MKILLRFDDICSTMNHSIWNELSEFLIAQDIRPIIAIVPANADPKLNYGSHDQGFWKRIAKYQDLSWAIALHGYSHELSECKGSNVFFAKLTEFTNLKFKEQEAKIRKGLDVFQAHGIECSLFVAPAHSFNDKTVKALKVNKIGYISDGMFLFPYQDTESQIVMVPQQLWSLRKPWFGTWTICFHHNNWTRKNITEFKRFVIKNRSNIVALDDIKTHKFMLVWLPNLVFGLVAKLIFRLKRLI